MPHTVIQHIPIGSEWVKTLAGLRLSILNNWWPDFDNDGLNRGHIAAINLNALSSYYFQVKLDNEPGAHYSMRYYSAVLYAEENQPGFSVQAIQTTR
jgi:hypothetical protein